MLQISEMAANWFIRELRLKEGQAVRFFVRYGAQHKFQTGFGLGISVEEPKRPAIETEVLGVRFFMTEDDVWYLDGHDLVVSYNGWDDDIRYECRLGSAPEEAFAIV